MDVSIAPVAAAAAVPPARAESVATVGRQPVVASTGEGLAQARLNAVVELISNDSIPWSHSRPAPLMNWRRRSRPSWWPLAKWNWN